VILSDQIAASGTVKYIGIEGGFFGIITPDDKKYLPLNLPEEFQVDGMQVTFTAREKPDTATTAMWGMPVELDSIASAGRQFLSLEGSWILQECDGQSLVQGTAITAEFGPDGMITGDAGCNQYFAPYTATGSGLTVGTPGSTKMMCPSLEGVMEQESAYLTLLGKAASWSVKGTDLVLRDAQGKEILVFTPAVTDEPAPLIEYSRVGGIAGLDDHLVLFSNGSGTVTRRGMTRSVRVPQPLMEDLISHITAADFPSLNDRYPAPVEGADYFTYTLTSGGKKVVTEDTGIPPLLVPIINTLNDIVSSVRMSVEYSHSGIPNFL
jgi:heat shock protein HslJ